MHKQRVAEVLSEPEAREKQRSRESLNSDTVKYESGPDGGEEVSMSVEWNGVSTVHSPHTLLRVLKPGTQTCRLEITPLSFWTDVIHKVILLVKVSSAQKL